MAKKMKTDKEQPCTVVEQGMQTSCRFVSEGCYFCKMWQTILAKNRQDFPLTSTNAVQQKKYFFYLYLDLKSGWCFIEVKTKR